MSMLLKKNDFSPFSRRSFLAMVIFVAVINLSCIINAHAQNETNTIDRQKIAAEKILENTKDDGGLIQATLTLQDNQARYSLGPHLYIVKDSSKKLTRENYEKIVARHLAGDRGYAAKHDVVNLGSVSLPHWIIFTVENRSWQEKWVLSFGEHMDGRFGLLQDLFIYDHTDKKTYVNTLNTAGLYNKQNTLRSSALTLNIPPGHKTLIFAYIVPKAGMPVTIAPELMTESAYTYKISNPISQTHLVTFFFLMMTGFFVATLLFNNMWGTIFFIAYYLSSLSLLLYQNDVVQMSFVLASHIPAVLFNVSILMALLMIRQFFGITSQQHTQNRSILLFSFAIVLSSLATTFLIPDNADIQILLSIGPALLAMPLLFLICLAQGYNGHSEGNLMAASWLIVFLGTCLSYASLLNLLTPSAILTNAYWYGLIIQGFLFTIAFMRTTASERRQREIALTKQQEEQEFVTDIIASKEASENARLLRMIEHEREVMNELRQRETEQNEAMRIAKEEADSANNAKSAFLAVISHEIRTPMTGIMGMIRFLKETKLTSEQKGYAQTLMDSGEAMMALLNDILDFEKIESGKMDLEYIDFDLHRLLNGVKTLMTGHAEAKNIFIKLDIDPIVPQYVIGDPVRLRQVILNLTGNSIKFTEKGGVTIHVKPTQNRKSDTTQQKSIHHIRFSVEDTGVGISKEAQQNLFNPFSQADSSVSRKYGGTGLGLAISQKLIEAMGGEIEINSTEGHGSTFFFSLTMEEGDRQAIEKAEESGDISVQRHTQSIQILIVEDNEINQKLMKELIERMGHKIYLASSGEEAIEKARTENLDMILMDIHLPGITGMGATKAIRALAETDKASVPIIALTGNVQEEDIRQCYAANMNGHLAKPVDPKKLRDQIDKVINKCLDNPIEINAEKTEEHTKITRLDVGDAQFGPNETESQSLASSTNNLDDKIASIDPEISLYEENTQEKIEEDLSFSPSPVMAHIRGLEEKPLTSYDLSAEELDEDSFEQAIINEQKNVTKSGNAPAKEKSCYDHELLSGLKTSLGDEKFSALLQDMMETLDKLLQAIEAANKDNDIASVGARAHELKGMAGNFGLNEISSLAASAEKAAKENHLDTLKEVLPHLPLAHQKVIGSLEEML